VTASLEGLWDKVKDRVDAKAAAVISGATGGNPATAEERAFLATHGELAVRATGSYLGHGLEPQFPMNLALATVALQHGSLFPPCDSTGLEKPMNGPLDQVVVTGVGHWRGEGLALVEKIA
jgi:3-oxoacyl-[acyl-carrier-protein] synthase II